MKISKGLVIVFFLSTPFFGTSSLFGCACGPTLTKTSIWPDTVYVGDEIHLSLTIGYYCGGHIDSLTMPTGMIMDSSALREYYNNQLFFNWTPTEKDTSVQHFYLHMYVCTMGDKFDHSFTVINKSATKTNKPQISLPPFDIKIAPNPFNQRTTISWTRLNTATTKIEVFNSKGKMIKILSNNTWNGQDSQGNQAPSGIYLIQLKAGGQVYNRRVSLVR